MVFEYYPESDMLVIRFNQEPSTESEEIAPGVVLDYGAEDRVIGVEIENASQFMNLSRLELRALPLTDLVFQGRVPVGT